MVEKSLESKMFDAAKQTSRGTWDMAVVCAGVAREHFAQGERALRALTALNDLLWGPGSEMYRAQVAAALEKPNG